MIKNHLHEIHNNFANKQKHINALADCLTKKTHFDQKPVFLLRSVALLENPFATNVLLTAAMLVQFLLRLLMQTGVGALLSGLGLQTITACTNIVFNMWNDIYADNHALSSHPRQPLHNECISTAFRSTLVFYLGCHYIRRKNKASTIIIKCFVSGCR